MLSLLITICGLQELKQAVGGQRNYPTPLLGRLAMVSKQSILFFPSCNDVGATMCERVLHRRVLRVLIGDLAFSAELTAACPDRVVQ